jgi:hypothetical protein
MGKVVNLLVVFIITRIFCGPGPALFGLMFTLAIPAGLILVLIGGLYPDGLAGFTESAFRTILRGFH